MHDAVTVLADRLRGSKKYRHLCGETIDRIAGWAVARHRDARDAEKAAKGKLHQVFAAYCSGREMDRLAEWVDGLPDPADAAALKAACRPVLLQHTSTAERFDYLDQLYPALFDAVGRADVVVDLACGFHPFALPWMAPYIGQYHACDIDHRLIDAANRFLARLGRPPTARCRDVLVGVPDVPADVALLLKAVPCLEQQEPGVSARILRSVRADRAVVSFPLQTIGGTKKGLRQHYDAVIARLADELSAPARSFDLPTESFTVLDLRAARRSPP